MVKLSLQRKAILAGSMLMMIPSAGHANSHADLQALKAQIQALTNKVNELEQKQAMPAPAPTPAPVVQLQSNPKLPESITIPGTKTSVKIGGYAKLDTIYDVGNVGGDFANFAAIPLDGSMPDARDGEFNMHARQTRLNFTTLTETSMGDLKTFVEGDFFGLNGEENVVNGHGFRLRHAYGEFMGIRAGQTWTNFMDMDVYPESLDYIGPVGLTLMRVPQFGYGDTIDKFTYRFSFENPSTDAVGASGETVAPAVATYNKTERVPDFTLATKYADTWGHIGLAGMLREFRAEDAVTLQEDTDMGWGLALSSKINLPFLGAKDNLKARVVYGDGIGRYIFDTRNQGATYNPVSQNIAAQEALGGHVALQHWWTDTLRTNIMGGYADIDTNAVAAATANEKIWSAHANLIWQPVPKYTFGLEYMHGERETKGNAEGSLDRIQGSFIYSF